MVDINGVLQKMKDKDVYTIFDMGNAWLVSAVPKGKKLEDYSDILFRVDKQFGGITEYAPMDNPKQFKNALKHAVYKRR